MKGLMITLGAAAIAMGASYVQAAPTPFTYSYEADALPADSSPAWASYFTGDASVSGGILTVTTPGVNGVGSPADPNSKEYRLTAGAGQPWDPTGLGTTVEIRVKTDYNADGNSWAGSLAISTASEGWAILIGEDYITVSGAGDYKVTTDDAFHTYRFVVSNETSGNLDLYIDGSTAIAHSWAGGSPLGKLAFGDLYTASLGQVEWDYVRWTNAGAFAPVPEPASLTLLALGGLAFRRRRA